MLKSLFPYIAYGKVVKGFGRGSKQLGIPTANFPDSVVENLPKDFQPGVYFGWASVDNGTVHKMVMSIGWNPFYHNKKRSMETHIIYNFQEDFYDSMLKVCLLGYIRPEKNFDSVDDLITAIHKDIEFAKTALDQPEYSNYQTNNFFVEQTNGQL